MIWRFERLSWRDASKEDEARTGELEAGGASGASRIAKTAILRRESAWASLCTMHDDLHRST